jgi:hypothetical protein
MIAERVRAAIESWRGDDPARRDAMLAEVARWQAEHVPPFAKLCAARKARFDAGADGWPAVPTDVFRHVRVAAHPPSEDVRVFRTSGTTSGARGEHAFRDLSIYDAAAKRAAEEMLFPDGKRRLVIVAPRAEGSSLAYMLERFEEWFATEARWAWSAEGVDLDAFRQGVAAGGRLAILGTSFALVHLCDALGAERFSLPDALVMQTGGFKGRSRELDPAQMRALLASRFGIAQDRIVSEYGMTELSSQMYGTERLRAPGWVRATPVDPETLRPVADGEVGILRVDDLANVGSAVSIQTSDLARREGGGIVLLGRAPGAVPRGCSLAIEEALS